MPPTQTEMMSPSSAPQSNSIKLNDTTQNYETAPDCPQPEEKRKETVMFLTGMILY